MNGRNIFLAALALAVVLALLTLASPGNDARHARGSFSSYSSAPRGTKGFYTLLKETGYEVARWRRPFTELPPDSLLAIVTCAPLEGLAQDEIARALGRVDSGLIWFVFVGPPLHRTLEALNIVALPDSNPVPSVRQVPAANLLWADTLTCDWTVPDDADMEMPVFKLRARTRTALPYYGNASGDAVLECHIGSGVVVVFNSPGYIANGSVLTQDNLNVIMGLIQYDASGSHRTYDRILFDEYHNGFREYASAMTIFDAWPVKAALLIALLAILLGVLSRARRIGRPVPVRQESRRNSADYVQSVSEVYQRAAANRLALKRWYDWVYHGWARKYHTNLHSKLSIILSKRHGRSPEEIAGLLEEIETKLKDAAAPPPSADPVQRRPRPIADDELVRIAKKLDALHRADQR